MNRAVVLPSHVDDAVGLHYWPGPIDLRKEGGTTMPVAFAPMHIVPESWRFPLLTLFAMLVLAGLDFAGAMFAKEWSDRGHTVLLIGGLASFSILFIVYARILAVAELSIVTLGWMIFLQIGILALDHLKYGMTLPWQKWAAILVILLLQTYLLTGSHSRIQDDVETGGVRSASLKQISRPLPR